MKRTSKVLALLFSLGMILGLSGCGDTAESTTDSAIDERIVQAKDDGAAFYTEKEILDGFWEASAGYACLGEDLYGKEISMANEDPEQRGAILMGYLMVGENPYDVDGKDLVQDILDQGTEGPYAVPILNFLALQAAGADIDPAVEAEFVEYCITMMGDLSMGPDMASWASIALARYMNDPLYSEDIAAAVDGYLDGVSTGLADGTMGSEALTIGCICLSLSALNYGGMDGCDPTVDSPWVDQDMLGIMYSGLTEGEEHVSDYYASQYYLEFGDLYNVLSGEGGPAWIACGVDADKLNDLLAEAAELEGNEAVDAAVAAIGELDLGAIDDDSPNWGKLYFDLRAAIETAKAAE